LRPGSCPGCAILKDTMTHHKKRILAVDDDPKITRLLRLNLEQTGDYEVREETRATHALAAAREFHPDLILLDVLMPGLDGGSLADHYRQSPDLRHIPIVFLTAAVTWEEVHARKGLVGGLPFLAKPVDLPEVIDCLRKHLGPAVQDLRSSVGPASPPAG
jgi:CheY-like chemotaxis protein